MKKYIIALMLSLLFLGNAYATNYQRFMIDDDAGVQRENARLTNDTSFLIGGATAGISGTGQDGSLKLYSEQGATDYTVTLNPNATMTSNANFYLPADEPAGTYLLNSTTGGVLGYTNPSTFALVGQTMYIGTTATTINRASAAQTLAGITLTIPDIGTPSAGVLTNCTGTAAGLTAGNVTTNASLTGPITSVGNATSITSQTGTGTKFVVDTSPTLVTPVLGVATGTSLNCGSPLDPTTGRIYASSTIGVFTDGGSAQQTLRSWSDTAATGSIFTFYRARGSYAAQTSGSDGDLIGVFYGYSPDTGNTTFRLGASYQLKLDGAPTASAAPMKHEWYGTTTLRMSLSNAGLLNIAGLTASQAVFTDASKNLVSNAITGSGNVVMSTSPTLVTPTLGVATATSIGIGMAPSAATGVYLDVIAPTGLTGSRFALRITDETVNNIINIQPIVGTSASSNSNSLGNLKFTITQATPSTLKSKLELGVNTGDLVVTALTLDSDLLATFAGHLVVESVTSTGATGTGKFVFDTSPTLVTPTLGVATATSLATTSNVWIGDTANAKNTLGLTANQGAADDEIVSLKSSDVAHTVTDITEADTYGLFKKVGAGPGGLEITGLNDGGITNTALLLRGIQGSNDPTDTLATVILRGAKQDALNGITTLGNAETVLKVQNSTTDLITVLGNGNTSFVGNIASTATSVTIAAAATTFAVASNVVNVTGDAGGNTVATITGGTNGQVLVLKFIDALVTITDTAATTANTVNLSAAFTSTANDIMTLVFDGNKWFEMARSLN